MNRFYVLVERSLFMTFPGPGGLAVSESHPGTGDTPGQSLDLEIGMFGKILFPQTLLNDDFCRNVKLTQLMSMYDSRNNKMSVQV